MRLIGTISTRKISTNTFCRKFFTNLITHTIVFNMRFFTCSTRIILNTRSCRSPSLTCFTSCSVICILIFWLVITCNRISIEFMNTFTIMIINVVLFTNTTFYEFTVNLKIFLNLHILIIITIIITKELSWFVITIFLLNKKIRRSFTNTHSLILIRIHRILIITILCICRTCTKFIRIICCFN
jgi:hypothetical protein